MSAPRCVIPLLRLLGSWAGVSAALSFGAVPAIDNLSLHGLEIGSTTKITISGKNLLPEPRLMMPVAIARQRLLEGSSSERIELEVTLSESVVPGIYPLHLVTRHGVSAPLAVSVDQLVQRSISATVPALPIALHGVLTGDRIVTTRFSGIKGQRLVVEVESRRLGAKLNPVLRLYNERGTQVAWSGPQPSLAGDARCALALPADGDYRIELHDVVRRGEAPGHFRLKLGHLVYVDRLHPAGLQRGTTGHLRFVSSNLSTSLLAAVTIAKDAPSGPRMVSWAGLPVLSGSAPRILVSDYPELVEPTTAGQQPEQVKTIPAGINGCLSETGQQDRYALRVAPGQKVRLELWGQRLGSPIDGVLSVDDPQGKRIAENDDQQGTADPGLEVEVPAMVDHLTVALRDLHGRGGSDYTYRIAVTPADWPDFRLKLPSGRLHLPATGHMVVAVDVQRRGYEGPIRLQVRDLPEGVTASETTILPKMDRALLTMSAETNQPTAALISVCGISTQTEPPMVRVAQAEDALTERHVLPLQDRLAIAVHEPSPIDIRWETPSEHDRLVAGQNLSVPVRLSRAEGTGGNIRISLVTNQTMPQKKVPDPKDKTKEIMVDDVERALRLDGTPVFQPDVWGANVRILVPEDLPRLQWDIALKAELLDDAGKTVVATAVTAARRLSAVDGPKAEAKSEGGG